MKEIMDASMMQRSLKRIAHEILECNKGADQLVLLGIKSRGEHLAKRLAQNINDIEGCNVDWAAIDVRFWRDDLEQSSQSIPTLELQLKDKIVILVDDVLYKGRTVRAAMDGIMHYGRAQAIQLAVLVDRGHRELPIRADYVGKNVPTSESEGIKVSVCEIDEKDGVFLINNF